MANLNTCALEYNLLRMRDNHGVGCRRTNDSCDNKRVRKEMFYRISWKIMNNSIYLTVSINKTIPYRYKINCSGIALQFI